MRAQSHPKPADRGAVLLHTLVLVALASGLITLVLVTARRSEDGFALLNQRLTQQIKIESAVAQVMLDLIDSGVRARWLAIPGEPQFAGSGTDAVEIRVTDIRGLVDLNAANPDLVARIIPPSTQTSLRMTSSMLPGQRRKFDDYATFAAAFGLSASDLVCLHAHMTLFSGQLAPDPKMMPAALAQRLGDRPVHGGPNTVSVMDDDRSSIGHTYKLYARQLSGNTKSETLVVEFYLTGRNDRPYLTRFWAWLPHPENNENCTQGR